MDSNGLFSRLWARSFNYSLGYQFNVIVYFTAMHDFKRNVLGRKGWLQQMRIGIIDYDGKLYLSAYDDEA